MARITILGSGAWGTTLGKVLTDAENEVIIWGIDAEVCHSIDVNHTQSERLPDVTLPANLRATTDAKKALKGAEFVIVAIAAQYARQGLTKLLPTFENIFSKDRAKWPVIISVMKGMEQASGKMMGEMIAEVLSISPEKMAVLAGPNLAKEVVRAEPAAATIASSSLETAENFAKCFAKSSYFKTEIIQDMKGTELLSCLKNVYAIAAGYYSGKGYGDSTIATVVTEAMHEASDLLNAIGGRPETLNSYAGLGDMIATCCSPLSRNHSFGRKLGEGKSVQEAASTSDGVSEGVPTVSVIIKLANFLSVKMPIAEEVNGLVNG